jgi:secreted trypsin-like serine protease
VTPRHVLLPAHCIQNKREEQAHNATDAEFYFTNNFIDDRGLKANVSELIVHPDWDLRDSHHGADIAIAVLEKPIKLSNEVRHVCLNTPSNPIQSFARKNGQVYGWELTEELKLVSELHHVEVPLVNQAKCNSSHADRPKIMSDTSFCAGTGVGKSGPSHGKNV